MSTFVIIILFTCLAVLSYLVWENDRAIWEMKEHCDKQFVCFMEANELFRKDLTNESMGRIESEARINSKIIELENHQSQDDKENPEQNNRMKFIELALAERDKEIYELKTELNNLKTVLAYKTVTFGG